MECMTWLFSASAKMDWLYKNRGEEIGQATFNMFHPLLVIFFYGKIFFCKRKQQKISFVPPLSPDSQREQLGKLKIQLSSSDALDGSNLDIQLDYDNNEYISLWCQQEQKQKRKLSN